MCEDKTKIADLVRRWGGSTSIALLDPAYLIFQVPGIEGAIGYRTASNRAVVMGDPIAPPESREALTKAYHAFCKENKWTVIYLAATNDFASWLIQNELCNAKVRIGDIYHIDPKAYPQTGPNGRLLKKKVKHAQGEGVVVEEYKTHDTAVEDAIEEAANAWLKGRRGPQIYMSHMHLFSDYDGKRWFYAKQNDKIVGVLLLNQLERYQGWLLNLLMPTPESPNGTSEIMALTAFDTLAAENCSYLSFGIVAGLKLDDIQGFNPLSIWLAKAGFKAADRLFHLEGRRRFWEKFEPQGTPSYVLFMNSTIRLGDLVAMTRALNVSVT